MTNEELRCEALRRALDLGHDSSKAVVERAEAFYRFLSGRSEAEPSVEEQVGQLVLQVDALIRNSIAR